MNEGQVTMTDKQIIIDGIDVSGCDCYCDGKCLCEYNEINRKIIRYYSCNKFPNCYYKQLKAKEQECEELRKANDEKNELLAKLGCPTIATARRKVFCLQEQLDQLKAENEGLKVQNIKYMNGNIGYQLKNSLYKQTIIEIKEIAEICKCHNTDGCYECKYFDDCEVEDEEIPTRDVCKLILQKISECEANQ